MKIYEITYLALPELEEDELNSLQEKIASFVEKESGVLVEKTRPIKKSLGYPLKEKSTAFLGKIDFQMAPDKIKELEKSLKEIAEILRYSIYVQKPKKIAKAPRKPKTTPAKTKPKKVELKEIEKKLEEILDEPE